MATLSPMTMNSMDAMNAMSAAMAAGGHDHLDNAGSGKMSLSIQTQMQQQAMVAAVQQQHHQQQQQQAAAFQSLMNSPFSAPTPSQLNALALHQQQEQQQQQHLQRLQHSAGAFLNPYNRSSVLGIANAAVAGLGHLHHHQLGMPVMGKDPRKKRIHASKSQLAILEASFQACPKPSSKARKTIAERIQLNERCVQEVFPHHATAWKITVAPPGHLRFGGFWANVILRNHLVKTPISKVSTDGPLQALQLSPPTTLTILIIWFQNRRARQKKMDKLALEADGGATSNPDSSSPPTTSDNILNSSTSDNDSQAQSSAMVGITTTTTPSTSGSVTPTLNSPSLHLRSASVSGMSGEEGMAALRQQQQQQQLMHQHARRFSMPDLGANSSKSNLMTHTNAMVAQPNDALTLTLSETFKASSVSIGTWRRISMTPGDLVCTFDPVRRSLRWMVIESTYGFQMEIPIYSILDVAVSRHTPAVAVITIDVGAVPTFSKEVRMGNGTSFWVPCDDFTEAGQASSCKRHILYTAASDPVILSFLAAVPHTSAGAAAASAGLVAPLMGGHPSTPLSAVTVATPVTASAAGVELDFTSLLSPSVDFTAALNATLSTGASTTLGGEMTSPNGFPTIEVNGDVLGSGNSNASTNSSASGNAITTMTTTTSTSDAFSATAMADIPGMPALPPILTDFGSLNSLRATPSLFSATTPLTTTTTIASATTPYTPSALTTPTTSLSSPPSATSSLSLSSSLAATGLSSPTPTTGQPPMHLTAAITQRRQSCPNLNLTAVAAAKRALHNNTTSASSSNSTSPLSRQLHIAAQVAAQAGDLPMFQRARSSSLSGLEVIFQQHAIRSPNGSVAGSAGNGSPVIPTPIMEVPEPPMSPLFGVEGAMVDSGIGSENGEATLN
ncbi:hypothetical protein HDU97_004065 [Phlyctochytrium planicorne]|nr:hypothetical protein HDU97_004065 [Phlyctochytrium planicorne]